MRRVLGTRWAVALCALSVVGMLVALGGCARVRSTAQTGGSTTNAPSTDATGEVVFSTAAFPDPRSVPPTMITKYGAGLGPDMVSIGWARSDDLLVVTTFGSGSCPRLIDKVVRETGNSIRIETSAESAAASPPTTTRTCTADLRPLTTTIRPPAGISAHQTLVVKVGSREWRIPPRG